MARDKLAEIAAVRGRGKSGAWRGKQAIGDFQRRGGGGSSYPAAFVVIRLVTALEVFTRDWVKELVDAGDPYINRAANLFKGTLKTDFAMAQGLVGKRLTFGDLVAHEIPLNSVADLDRVFTHLLDSSVFERLTGVVDRWDVEVLKKPATPIMADVRQTRRLLHELFELRHIHVHELPDDADIEPEKITQFVDAALGFCEALDQLLSTELHGNYPLTQLEMNSRASEDAQLAEAELQSVIARLDPQNTDEALRSSQEAWECYRARQAEYRSDINSPTRGSIASFLYALEVEKITRARIKELLWYLECEDRDM